MSFTRRDFLQASTLLAAPALGAFPMVSTASKRTFTYGGSSWLGHYSAHIAIKAGIFEKKGLNIEWQNFATSSDRMSAVMSSSIDLAGTGVVSALALMAAGVTQFKLLTTPNNFGRAEGLLVRSDVSHISQLKGKKIGVTFASSTHVLILDLLKQAGLNADKDVSLINIPSNNLMSAYQSNQVDAVLAWTPSFDRIKALPNTKMLADDTSFSLYKSYDITPGPDVILASTKMVKESPDAIKPFLEGIFEANAMLSNAPEEAAKLLLPLTGLTLQEQLGVVKGTVWYGAEQQRELMVQPGNFVIGMQKLAEMLVSLKQIDRVPAVSKWVDASYV